MLWSRYKTAPKAEREGFEHVLLCAGLFHVFTLFSRGACKQRNALASSFDSDAGIVCPKADIASAGDGLRTGSNSILFLFFGEALFAEFFASVLRTAIRGPLCKQVNHGQNGGCRLSFVTFLLTCRDFSASQKSTRHQCTDTVRPCQNLCANRRLKSLMFEERTKNLNFWKKKCFAVCQTGVG